MANSADSLFILNTSVASRQPVYRDAFASAQPFRHVVIDDFFTAEFCRKICEQFPRFDEKKAINENGEVGGKATREKARALGSAYRQLDDTIQSEAFLQWVGHITGIDKLRYDPYYFGGGTHENRHGQDLDPHIDFNYHPITRQHRRLNLIVYLNDTWEDAWGGALQLHRDPYVSPEQDDIVTLSPRMNRCVIFETNEHSWHGFERINLPGEFRHLSRKSFALYFYTDSRPAEETADEHSTVYVERHLPARFQPGMALAETDVQELRILLSRRDQHLKRLYQNIHHLYGEFNRLKSQLVSFPHKNAGSGSCPGDTSPGTGDAEHIISALQARIHELEHSTSWRITSPLRSVRRLLSRRK